MKHETAIDANPNDHTLKKFILYAGEKERVLEKLYLMNISDYTLFGDEESLMRTLAYTEFHNYLSRI